METGKTVGHYEFGAWDLPTKYHWMHSGPGVQSATQMQDVVTRMAERMIKSGNVMRDLLNGAEWAGAAASAAGQAMQRGAGQISQAAAGPATAQRHVAELGESFVTAQRRVPSPNEVPAGLGDVFLFGAAEGFNAVSPFDVQSPLHDALEQRRELDRQANQALTDHMNTSREHIEAMPSVATPGPITVVGQHRGPAGVGGVGQPAGAAPSVAGAGGAPSSTLAAGWAGVPAAPQVATPSPGPGGSGTPLPPGVSGPVSPGLGPVATGPARAPGSPPSKPRPSVPGSPGSGFSGSQPGAFGPYSSGRVAGVAARDAGFGARGGAGGDSGTSRSAPGLGGPTSGPIAGSPGSRGGGIGGTGAAGGTGAGGIGAGGGGTGTGRAGAHSFLHPPVGGHARGDDDTEHKDRYAQAADYIVGDLPLVAPAVIGETPEEAASRLRRE